MAKVFVARTGQLFLCLVITPKRIAKAEECNYGKHKF